ncbi:histone H1 [Parapedobacter sp. ISTM3]|uniref:Histone H1-like protein Hc1 n=1 Tax=Parapedobacter luteus TaxID=623280 RepID=A0A1T5BK28_9SPHI|nr:MULTISPECIES: histone H1 [Parapedobacter]MBK1439449.1 histone H1 [Parapedobacter sp. ISTM3]SKB47515.1 Histone H1-like protein Hc1 [Parapedobacter luteus]
MEKYSELKSLIASIEEDAVKFFEKGNNAAGTRVRTGLQKVKALAQEIRNAVTEAKNTK